MEELKDADVDHQTDRISVSFRGTRAIISKVSKKARRRRIHTGLHLFRVALSVDDYYVKRRSAYLLSLQVVLFVVKGDQQTSTIVRRCITVFTCIQREENSDVYSWGHGLNGRLGHGDEHDILTPKVVEALLGKGVKEVRTPKRCTRSTEILLCTAQAVSSLQ